MDRRGVFYDVRKWGKTYMHSVGVGARVYHLDGLVVEKPLILHFQRRSVTQGSVMKSALEAVLSKIASLNAVYA